MRDGGCYAGWPKCVFVGMAWESDFEGELARAQCFGGPRGICPYAQDAKEKRLYMRFRESPCTLA